jgi:hypothetical protein
MNELPTDKVTSRRQFLADAGTFAAGAIVAGGLISTLTPAQAEAAQALPWPYQALDPQLVGDAAHTNYKTGGCMYATGKALVDALATATGSPWDTFNPDLMKFGGGGISSWGSLCGSANAGAAVIQMVAGANAAALIDEFYGWYSEFPFPTTRFDAVSLYPNQGTTIANSPLCHQSSGIWATTNGFKINSPERKERCAKVAADCAYKVVELLNAWKAGTFVATKFAPDFLSGTATERCFGCHVGATSRYDNAQGKMNCLTSGCHPNKATHHL